MAIIWNTPCKKNASFELAPSNQCFFIVIISFSRTCNLFFLISCFSNKSLSYYLETDFNDFVSKIEVVTQNIFSSLVLRSRTNSCYSLLFPSLKPPPKKNIIISRDISSNMCTMYIETSCIYFA